MIKENQKFLNRLQVVLDAFVIIADTVFKKIFNQIRGESQLFMKVYDTVDFRLAQWVTDILLQNEK